MQTRTKLFRLHFFLYIKILPKTYNRSHKKQKNYEKPVKSNETKLKFIDTLAHKKYNNVIKCFF